MKKRNAFLALAGAAAVCFVMVQLTKCSTHQSTENMPRDSQQDARRVPAPPAIIELQKRLEMQSDTPDWKMEREKNRKQDRERNLFEWRDARLGSGAFALSVPKG